MKLFSGKQIINQRAPKVWYMPDQNINYSFSTLEKIAKDLGANLNEGDVLIIDNENGDRRKAFRKTMHGSIILYASLNKVKFEKLKSKNNMVIEKTFLLDVFEQ